MKTKQSNPAILLIFMMLFTLITGTVWAEEQKFDDSTPTEEVKKFALEGDVEAMAMYGMRLMAGQGVDNNSTQGLMWIQKSIDAGNTEGWYAKGVVYANGIGVEADFTEAIKYFRSGGEAGNANCQTSMGMFYQAGDRIPSGIDMNIPEAVNWYKKAAEQNHTEAIQHLAMIYARGQGVEINDDEAVKWFRKGAELGNSDCMWGLGQCCLEGKGVAQDSVTAYALFIASLDGIQHLQQKTAMEAKSEELAKVLSENQRKEAEPIIAQWREKYK